MLQFRIACEAAVVLGAIMSLVLEVKDVLLTQGARAMLRSFVSGPSLDF